MTDNIINIDPIYIKYRRMWKEDRWNFSGELVKLTIKGNRDKLDNIEQHTLKQMKRIIDENDGNWTDGYEYNDGVLKKKNN